MRKNLRKGIRSSCSCTVPPPHFLCTSSSRNIVFFSHTLTNPPRQEIQSVLNQIKAGQEGKKDEEGKDKDDDNKE